MRLYDRGALESRCDLLFRFGSCADRIRDISDSSKVRCFLNYYGIPNCGKCTYVNSYPRARWCPGVEYACVEYAPAKLERMGIPEIEYTTIETFYSLPEFKAHLANL